VGVGVEKIPRYLADIAGES
jgi:hypothetical protein